MPVAMQTVNYVWSSIDAILRLATATKTSAKRKKSSLFYAPIVKLNITQSYELCIESLNLSRSTIYAPMV